MNLFCYLLDNCCPELRTMIFMACAQYMPVPLIANRPHLKEDIFHDPISDEEDFSFLEREEII